ncbi:MAG: hypothetical protein RL589_56 [Actinomycetota bacterium]|jgi:ABC-type polysaccharide/polyol phosphate transport system ATPase subunit
MRQINQDESIDFSSDQFLIRGSEGRQVTFEFNPKLGLPCIHIDEFSSTSSTLLVEITISASVFSFGINSASLCNLDNKEIRLQNMNNSIVNFFNLLTDYSDASSLGKITVLHIAGGADTNVTIPKFHLSRNDCKYALNGDEVNQEDLLENEASELVMAVRDLTVSVPVRKGISIKSLLPHLRSDRQNVEILTGVNFELRHGEILGLIGHNGAGKSTLLRALVGAIGISNGRIIAKEKPLLLRPGFGFREEFSAKLNIIAIAPFLNRTYNYMRSQVSAILDFADVEKHAELPFRYFSDGMKARLIFATALEARSSILLMDEIMSAGDINFRNKVLQGVDALIVNNGAGIMASHDLSFISESCPRSILIEDGRQVYYGPSKKAINLYKCFAARKYSANQYVVIKNL